MKKNNKMTLYCVFIFLLTFISVWITTPIIILSFRFKEYGGDLSGEQLKEIFSLYANPFSCFSMLLSDSDLFFCWFKVLMFLLIISIIILSVVKELDFGDQQGVNYLEEDGTHGTAKWMKEEEAQEILDVGTEKGIVFGTLNDNMVTLAGEETKKVSSFLNKNIAIFGASGSMKSRSFVRPNIMQIAEMGQSIIVTDPKGEIFESMAQFLKDRGYTVRVLNLVNMIHSDRWNPLAEVTDDISAQTFAETVMANTKAPGAKSDEFWEKTETNLLKALVLYVIKENEPEKRNLASVCSMLALNDAKTIDKIFETLSNIHPAKMPYNVYCQASENVRTGVVIGLATKLQVFQSKLVQDLTATSDIDLTLPKKEKCAYFCITSDMESTFDFIAGLFFSFLFIKLTKYADYAPKDKQKDVFFILDEFPNIGAIPDFTKKISTMRSRGISSFVIFQNIAQLKNRYPNDGWAEIIGNCDSRLFLGATDIVTAEFVCKLLGTASVRSVSKKKEAGLKGLFDFGSLTISAQKRNLLNPDEILKLDAFNAVLILKGQQPLLLEKMDYTKHKLSKDMKLIAVSDYRVEWAEEYYKKLEEGKDIGEVLIEKEEESLNQLQEDTTLKDESMDIDTFSKLEETEKPSNINNSNTIKEIDPLQNNENIEEVLPRFIKEEEQINNSNSKEINSETKEKDSFW